MTPRGTASTSRPAVRKAAGTRLSGIDAARGLALLGMMATHVFPTFESNAQLTPTWVGLVFSGRASALFAVLAGIGLALSTGKQQPLQGPQLWAARRGIALRALVVGAVGLAIGGLEVNIAIILVHYAVLFLCVLPFLGLDVKRLLVLALGWVLAAPALAFLLRPWLLAAVPTLQLGHNPQWGDLSTPAVLLGDLFLTGYYPVLQWIAYLLIGLAIGRLALTSAAVPALLLAAGTVVAVLAKWLGVVMMEDWGGRAALQASLLDPSYPLESLLQVNLAGVDQTGSAWWLASSAPHSGTTLDLLHTSGVAAAVVGACLLLGRLVQGGGWDFLLPLRGAGAMTLSFYTAHLCVMAALYGQPLPSGWTLEGIYWAQAGAILALGAVFAALVWRGPLEWVAHAANQLGRYQPARIR
ncbi:heparan-alpha-glucosaminide N-acetyltransferase domain-containing protein [Arthrobacter sp. PsM3]|uniref:heparan-alpha-glucosaminide N-acetyltransferase domain-containing protein n=1 Tax=Arthrobacter sp. PsM3 TaxID=3030531 RepID=UPI00263B8116|nr:heparan-alpha-glucosaminide N-acetyltransferase domain-containing protein [Arthrobacter sp. PsM3]MDN4645472.1 heparan-alpha-glucosaminide N-acetyltransferase domain-containing protein [Arthrobacter sp. PsM3]